MSTETLTPSVVPVQTARHIMTRLLGGLCLALLSSPTYAQEWVSLEQLTVPAEVLPDGCQLAPRGGLPFVPMDSNPVITKDSQAIRLLAGFVLMFNAELLAKFEAVIDTSEDLRMHEESMREQAAKSLRIQEEWIREQAAKIEAAYSAMYYDKDHKEAGVWALLFKEPIDPQDYRVLSGDRPIITESIVITVWTDSEDRSCYDAIRAFLETVSIK